MPKLRKNYLIAKKHEPIALLNFMSNVLKNIIFRNLSSSKNSNMNNMPFGSDTPPSYN